MTEAISSVALDALSLLVNSLTDLSRSIALLPVAIIAAMLMFFFLNGRVVTPFYGRGWCRKTPAFSTHGNRLVGSR